MAISVVQKGDTGGATSSGSAGTVLPANATIGNTVTLCVVNNATTGSVTPSGMCSTWTLKSTQVLSIATVLTFTGVVTSAVRTVTVTNSAGSTWDAVCIEASGVGSSLTAGTASGSTANPSLAIASTAAQMVVAISAVPGAFSAGPSTPWVDYNAGAFLVADGQDVAYNIITSGTSTTVTWTATAQSWAIAAVILVPAETAAVSASLAVAATNAEKVALTAASTPSLARSTS